MRVLESKCMRHSERMRVRGTATKRVRVRARGRKRVICKNLRREYVAVVHLAIRALVHRGGKKTPVCISNRILWCSLQTCAPPPSLPLFRPLCSVDTVFHLCVCFWCLWYQLSCVVAFHFLASDTVNIRKCTNKTTCVSKHEHTHAHTHTRTHTHIHASTHAYAHAHTHTHTNTHTHTHIHTHTNTNKHTHTHTQTHTHTHTQVLSWLLQ